MTSYALTPRFHTFRALSQTFFLKFGAISQTFSNIWKNFKKNQLDSGGIRTLNMLSLEADALPLRHEGKSRKRFYKTRYHSCFR